MNPNFGKKYYALLSMGVLLLLISTIVYAEAFEATTTNSTSSKTTVTQDEEQISDSSTTTVDISSTSEPLITDTKTPPTIVPEPDPSTPGITLDIAKQSRITNLCANISNRLEAAIYRQDNIAQRLQTRMKKMKAQSLDTNLGEEKLEIAMATINQAKDAIKNIDTTVYQTVTAIDPKIKWLSLRATYLETDRLVKQAHEELRVVISTLKNPETIITETTEINIETSTTTTSSE
ncbi:MAG: hypothetical protein ABL927_08295 [Bdellovibrionales bacterium]|nr:hypothetical protein [Candidatus Paceibacterota bacterium]